jgi:hypothetical protein
VIPNCGPKLRLKAQYFTNANIDGRPWKDHFKSDLRSDQDHLLKKDLRSDQDHIFFKSDLDLLNQDQRSFFAPKVPFLRVKFSKRTKSRL